MLSDAKRSVFWSGVQQVTVFGLQLVTTLIIARLITPEDYGIIAMTIVFFSIAQVILDFGMEGALIQKKECKQEDYDTAFFFSTAMSLLFYCGFYLASGWIAGFFAIPQLEKVIKISAAVLVIRAIGIAPYSKMQRELRFRNLARISAAVTLVSGAVAIYMAYKGFAYWALIAQTLLSAAAMTLLYFAASKWFPRFRISGKSFRQLVSFGFPMMLTSLINAVYNNLYTLVIGKKFDKKQLGLFNRAATFAGYVPTNLSDFSQRALFPIFSRYQDDLPLLRQQAVRTMHLTAFVAVPLNLFFLVNASDIISLVLKDRWIDIVPMIRLLCAAHLSYIVCNIHMNLFKAIKRTDRLFVCETTKKILGVIILVVTLPMGIMPMIWGLLAFNFINIVIGALFIHPLVGLDLKDHLKSLVPTTAVAIASVLAAYYPASLIENIYARVITSGITAALLFLGVSKLMKDEAVPFFLGYFRRR